jgi:dienelactone hydrolase
MPVQSIDVGYCMGGAVAMRMMARSPRPLGHASTRQALRELREQYRTLNARE